MKKAWFISIFLHVILLFIAFFTMNWSRFDDESQNIEALPIKVDMIADKNSMRQGKILAEKKKPPHVKKTQENPKDDLKTKYNNAQKSKLDTNKKLDKWGSEKQKNEHQKQEVKQKSPASNEKNPIAEKKEKTKEKTKEETKEKETEKAKEKTDTDLKNKIDDSSKNNLDKFIEESLLIDKTRTKGGGQNNSKEEDNGYGGKEDIGEDNQLAETLAAKISSCVKGKFNVIALGGTAQSNLEIHVRLSLNEDGSIAEIQEISAMGGDTRLQNIGINQANAALHYCAPFDLPRDHYKLWQQIDMVFDPYS